MKKELIEILQTYNTILENKKIVYDAAKNLITEAAANSGHLFNNMGFKWGGGPSDHGSRKLGNWQSDNAWDIMAPAGTPVYAIEGGTITKLGGDERLKRGVIYGYNITIKSENNEFFYTHLGSRNSNLEIGTKINKGDFLGTIGAPKENPKWPQHVHIGIKIGDISKYVDRNGRLFAHSGISSGKIDTGNQETQTTTTSNLDQTQKQSGAKIAPIDTMLAQKLTTSLNKTFGIKESLGRDVIEKFGAITIPASSNEKIISPVKGIVDNSKYVRGCANQITIKINDNKGYLQFCGISNPSVKNGSKVNAGTVLGKTKTDVEVIWFDKSRMRKNLENNSFDHKQNLKKRRETNLDTKKELTYRDPALAAIPTFITSVFSDKIDKEGNVEKRWGYSTDKDQVDPWIVNAISKPFKKIGKALGTNKSTNESKKIQEEINRIKGLLK